VSRSDWDRLLDSLEAGVAIAEHRSVDRSGTALSWTRSELRIEIGEAVEDVAAELLSQQPSFPWRQVAAMRDQLAHRYFGTSRTIVARIATRELVESLTTTRSPLAAVDVQG